MAAVYAASAALAPAVEKLLLIRSQNAAKIFSNFCPMATLKRESEHAGGVLRI